ncbi:MAG: helix-turn-helix domain-containing protein [Candidatus Sericytochromatia bacterium]|nr:helix-turn-helix domain-containing protein [Candidatus Sericytochromatia bacterium]
MSNERLSTPEASKALGIPVHVISYWLGQIPYPAEQDENGQWRLTPEALSVLQTVKELKEQNHSMETIRRMVRELAEHPPLTSSASPVKRTLPPENPIPAPVARSASLAAAAARGSDTESSHLPRIASSSGLAAEAAAAAPFSSPPGLDATAPSVSALPLGKSERSAPAIQGQRSVNPQSGGGAPPVPPGDAGTIAAYVAKAVAEAVRQETVLSHRYAHAAHQIGKLEAENEHLRQMLNTTQKRHQREVDALRSRLDDADAVSESRTKTPLWAWLTMLALL